MADKEEIIEDGEEEPKELDIDTKTPDEPEEAKDYGTPPPPGPKKKADFGAIFKGIGKIHKEGPDTMEDRNEPHTHLLLLLILVVVLGGVIAFTGI